MEEERQALIITSANNNRQLKEIEDKILSTLSHSEGNILEDETAIEILDSSKLLSDDIAKKQKVGTMDRIENNRIVFIDVNHHGIVREILHFAFIRAFLRKCPAFLVILQKKSNSLKIAIIFSATKILCEQKLCENARGELQQFLTPGDQNG